METDSDPPPPADGSTKTDSSESAATEKPAGDDSQDTVRFVQDSDRKRMLSAATRFIQLFVVHLYDVLLRCSRGVLLV